MLWANALKGGGRVLTAWTDLRGSMRRVLDWDPREGTLLAMAFASSALHVFGRVTAVTFSPQAATISDAQLEELIHSEIAAGLIVRTFALYLIAGLAGIVARALGGEGSWKATRAATFWSALIAAPILLAGSLLSIPLNVFGPQAVMITALVCQAAFAWAFANCLAEAHKFPSAMKIFGGLAAAGLLLAVFAAISG